MYIDLKANAIFCRAKAETNREIFERFIMTQTVKCEKYIKLLEGYIEKAKISDKVTSLKEEMMKHLHEGKPNKKLKIQSAESLIDTMTQIMVANKKHLGKKPYSNWLVK